MSSMNTVLVNLLNVNVTTQGIGTIMFILVFVSVCDNRCVFDGPISYIAVAVTTIK